MGKPWFRTKRYGFGAGAPCSWEGWAASLAFIAAITIFSGLSSTDASHTRLWVALQMGAIFGFVVLVWLKSDKPWGWRWGGE